MLPAGLLRATAASGAACRLDRWSRRRRHAPRRISRAPRPPSRPITSRASSGRPRACASRLRKESSREPCMPIPRLRSHRPLAAALAADAGGARARARLGAVAARALRRGPRLRRDLPRGAGAVRVGAVPGRAGARPAAAERSPRRQRRAQAQADLDNGPNSGSNSSDGVTLTGRQPIFNRARAAPPSPSRSARWSRRWPISTPPSRT